MKSFTTTDLPAVGGLPETWAFTSNFVPFVGPNGAGRIKKVVPLGNKLLVFTMAGLFTLIVEGPPASWILRLLDSKSISTTNQCAFESKGIVYYINSVGVWATNSLYNTKISGVIEDQFFLAKGHRTHSIVPYEDGLLISISKITEAHLQLSCLFAPNCRIFYSKLDPVAWTEWNIETKSVHPTPIANRRICLSMPLRTRRPDGQAVRRTVNQDFTVGNGSNLAQIPAMFHYRRCGLIFSADLQSNDTQIKIKDMAIVQNVERGEYEKIR